jgi:hypothetical protein
MKQGQWGGIHAVYNVYNATRLVEFTEFARLRGLSIQWQSLYQPDCLDPHRLGPEVCNLALAEIDRLLATNLCLDSERAFFESVQQNFNQSIDDLRNALQQHIDDMENKYHPDQLGQFTRLWPELSNLL